jgi:hypothetical protein
MYKTFRHGGKIGDAIFSLPTIRELGGGILYLPERTPDACSNLYSGLKDLLLQQPFIKEVREYPSGLPYMQLAPDIHIDYDLDRARLQPMKGVVHIVKRYMDAFGINYPNWKELWLKVEGDSALKGEGYVAVSYTGRHIKNEQLQITSKVNWCQIIESLSVQPYFIGLYSEWVEFSKTRPGTIHLFTKDILDVARIVRDAQAVYCNQSSTLALAQSLGKTYYLDVKPMKQNCLLHTSNENILQ